MAKNRFRAWRYRVAALVLIATLAAGGKAPADDSAVDVQHNLSVINEYRAKAGVPPMTLDDGLSAYAQAGSEALKTTHEPHGHFSHSDPFASGFHTGAAENQGDPGGWPIRGSVSDTIDDVLKSMMGEGPGGGHHDNMLDRKYKRLGVGIVKDGGRLYLTNDFSG